MYWIYELEMPEKDKNALINIAEKEHMTTDQMFAQWISYLYAHPDEAERIKESWKKMDKEEKNRIRLIRIYSVYNGESETEAYRRTVRREQQMPSATEMTEEEKMSL